MVKFISTDGAAVTMPKLFLGLYFFLITIFLTTVLIAGSAPRLNPLSAGGGGGGGDAGGDAEDPTQAARQLTNGQGVPFSLSANEEALFFIIVPINAASLEVTISGGGRMYTRYNAIPTASAHDCSVQTEGKCTYISPILGKWYVLVIGPGSGQLAAAFTEKPDEEPPPDEPPPEEPPLEQEPQLVGSVSFSGYAQQTRVSGDVSISASYLAEMDLINALSPDQAEVVGQWGTPGLVKDIALKNGIAYVADGRDGLRIIDVTDLNSPHELAVVSDISYASLVRAEGNRVYVIGRKLSVIDITDPAKPSILGTSSLLGLGTDMAVDQNRVACRYSNGVRLVDATDPADINPIADIDIGGRPMSGLALSGNLLIINTSIYGGSIYDLSDPTAPQLLSNLPTISANSHYGAVKIRGNYAFIASWNDGLLSFDISDPTNPIILGRSHKNSAFGYYLALDGPTAYMNQDAGGIHVIDLTDPVSPNFIKTVTINGYPGRLAAEDGKVLAASRVSRIRIADIADKANPTALGAASVPGSAVHMDVGGKYAYWGLYRDGLGVVDFSDPDTPRLNIITGQETAGSVKVVNNTAYSTEFGGYWAYDLTDPFNPEPKAKLVVNPTLYTYSGGLTAANGYVYFCGGEALGEGPYHLYTIASPDANPTMTNRLELDWAANYLDASNDLLIACIYNQTILYSLENPANPVETARWSNSSNATGACLAGKYLFLSVDWFGVSIFDVSDPTNPVEVGSVDTPGYANHLVYQSGFLYVADAFAGLQIIDVSPLIND